MSVLRWTSKTIDHGRAVEVFDTIAIVTDKDSLVHTIKFEPRIGMGWDGEEYVTPSLSIASAHLERQEYLLTDKGLMVPRCNIKHIKLEESNPRMFQPRKLCIGMQDWSIVEWAAFFMVSFIALVATAAAVSSLIK